MLHKLNQNKWYLFASFIACSTVYTIYIRDYHASAAVYPLALFMIGFIPLLPKRQDLACLLVLLLSGVAFSIITPVLNTPDEYVHLSRAMHIAQGDINLDNNPENLQISEDYFVIIDDYNMPPLAVNAFEHQPSSTEVPFRGLADFRTTNAYWFIGYIPQVIGITLGRILHLNVGLIYYLGRILNALCYALLAYIAVKLSGNFRQVMMLIVLMPMNIFLAASYNQDGVALGLIYVIIGLFIHYLTRQKPIGYPELVIFTALSCLIITLKLPYILLMGLLFFIPKERFSIKSPFITILLASCIIFALTAIWFIGYQQIKSTTTLQGVGLVGQIQYFLSNPTHGLLALSKEFFMTPHRLVMLFYFGILNLPMRETLIPIFTFYLCVIASNLGQKHIALRSRIGSILIGLGIICAIILVMYLTWTKIGYGHVDGIQGRYYLGVLPLFALSITTLPIKAFTPFRIPDDFVIKGSWIVLTMVLVFIVLSTY
ncbi:DUF2142 domain-containing protein [Streptococcus suis]|uniref:DUF2142 domain-containing protein n=1 Tax=Streptococcus suis TaxID=1307 RepID=UPI000CF71671|nr:DUF2142 domain-containing protein [Streptococcus suis]